MKCVLRGPRTPRDIRCHEICQEGSQVILGPLLTHFMTTYVSSDPRTPKDIFYLFLCVKRGPRATYDSFDTFHNNICPQGSYKP